MARNMKCPNCGAEVHEEDKFCGECGKPLRRKIEMAPIWKWGSMIASLTIVFILWLFGLDGSPDELFFVIHITGGAFAFPAIIYLMYKERTEKIKYGLVWILFPILTLCLGPYEYKSVYDVYLGFLVFVIPAIIIDVIYVYKTR